MIASASNDSSIAEAASGGSIASSEPSSSSAIPQLGADVPQDPLDTRSSNLLSHQSSSQNPDLGEDDPSSDSDVDDSTPTPARPPGQAAHIARLDKQLNYELKDLKVELESMREAFWKPFPKEETDNITWMGKRLPGTKKAMQEIARAVNAASNKNDRVIVCKNHNSPVGPSRWDTPACIRHQPGLDETPDVVILSHEAASSNPLIAASWTQVGPQDKDVRDWNQLAAVGIIRPTNSPDHQREAGSMILRHLYKLFKSSIRQWAYGFTLLGSTLIVYVTTPSGLFYTPSIECTQENGHFSTCLLHTLAFSDKEAGILGSLGGTLSLEGLTRVYSAPRS
ncbi:BQ2448_6101 [Microbotryum intermedium]|uniref:BQ2448_6101 protein n=1 Tax=Microbotryum intermedium TaxID=269621 RepID=A0A238FNC4_9BASI|nr:BQ2448_6101 [Microbotryum intermedium]